MVDQALPPQQKLYARLALAEQTGKLFDERIERQALGLEMPTDREPIFIPEAQERSDLTRREEAQAKAEDARLQDAAREAMRREAEIAGTADATLQLRRLQERNAELERQLAERTGAEFPPPSPVAEVPAAGETQVVGERPDQRWTKEAILEWARERQIAVPRSGVGLSRDAVLDHVLGELEQGDPPPAEEPSGELEEATIGG